MRSIDSATLAELSSNTFKLAFLARIEFPSPYELAFTTLARQYTFDGTTFIGAGSLGQVSAEAESGNPEPSQYKITLSGINDDILSASGQLNYMNSLATVWAMTIDDDDQVIGAPFIWFRGLTDQVTITYGETSSVVIDVRDRMSDWSRPRLRRWTDEDHQSEYPGDKFFEFVSEVAGRDLVWPADSWFEKNQG